MTRNTVAFVSLLVCANAATAAADSLRCDLSKYKAAPGLIATMTGDLLVVDGTSARRTINADVEWTNPLSFVEVVWGTDRRSIVRSFRPLICRPLARSGS